MLGNRKNVAPSLVFRRFGANLPGAMEKNQSNPQVVDALVPAEQKIETEAKPKVEEIGGPEGPDPTRFGDWSVKGRCIDF